MNDKICHLEKKRRRSNQTFGVKINNTLWVNVDITLKAIKA